LIAIRSQEIVSRILETDDFLSWVDTSWVKEEQIIQRGKAIAEAIKARRETLGLSMNVLSQKAGISIQSVSFIETAVNSPSLSTFMRICAALEVSPDSLLRDALEDLD
jgi:DNA-binding Xre family transcriptional regulator